MSVGGRIRWLVRHTLAQAWHDRILGLSAEAAFWQLLSLPSLALAGVASLGYVSRWFGPDTVNRTETQLDITFTRAFSPDVVAEIVRPTLREVLHGQRIDVISIGFVLALWAGSSATATFVNTITIAYGMRDQRGAVRSRLLALWLFLGSVLLGVVLLPILVLGAEPVAPRCSRRVCGRRPTPSSTRRYYPVVVVLLLIGLTSLYHLAPPRRLPWHRGAPGALLADGLFLPDRSRCAATSGSSSITTTRTARSPRRSRPCCSSTSWAWACCSAPSSTRRSSRWRRPDGVRRGCSTRAAGRVSTDVDGQSDEVDAQPDGAGPKSDKVESQSDESPPGGNDS